MHVVLLAAGLGSRLGSLTAKIPKALISVAGESLLAHALRFAGRVDPEEVIVVGGYGFAEVEAEIARLGSRARSIENPDFRDGNLLTLLAARRHVRGGFLVMNVDHIYRPAIAEIVSRPVSEVTAFVDFDRELGPDDMKVARDEEGRVKAIAKTLATHDAGYVGMTRVPAEAADRYWATADEVLAHAGRAVHVERVLGQLATVTAARPHCRDISGVGWLEVDLPAERDLAEAVIAKDRGAWR